MKSISAPFINRPIATTLLAIAIAISGLIAFQFLPVSALPQIEFPTINVQASLPGASPEIMASSVATPLERQLGKIASITEMTSSSTLGSTNITVQFDLSRNIDGAARDVQAAINAARSQLPTDLPIQPTYRKVNPADSPIMIIALTSTTYSSGQMYDVASTVLQQKIAQAKGVGNVIVGGSSLPAVRVELNPTVLNKYGIGLEKVREVLNNANANRPKGQINQGAQTYEITTNDQIFRAYDYQHLIVDVKNGNPVRLSDVAEVTDSVEDLRNAGLANSKPAIVLIVFKQPGANVIETVDNLRDMLPQLEGMISSAIDLNVMMDRTNTIRASLQDVEFTLCIAVILVILVIYLFLRNARAAFITSISVPLCLLGTFALMYLFNFTLDNLSLMALTIATGFVIDDAVVVLENISRYIEAGLTPRAAALKGSKEVSFTVISMTTSLIAVFLPILLMPGIVGRLFREFAITLSIALVISLMVALTLTPMMSAKILKQHKLTQKEKSQSFIFTLRDNYYAKGLHWALNHRHIILWITLGTIFLSILLYMTVPKGFFPQQDTGRIVGTIQAEQNISFQSMKKKLSDFAEIVKNDPAVESVAAFVGGGGGGGGGGRTSNSGSMFVTLKPLVERKVSSDEVINRLRDKLSAVPASNLYLVSAQDLVVGGRQSTAQYLYTLTAFDLETLNQWAPRVLSKMEGLPGIVDLNTDQLNQGLQAFVTIDRDSASRFGISAREIDNTLYDAFGQRQVSVMYTNMNQYHVVMEVAPKYWQNPQTLKDIYVTGGDGQQVPLAAFASFDPSSTLLRVSHLGQFPAANLSFNLLPGTSLGKAVDSITEAVDEINLPEGSIVGAFRGTAQAFKAALVSEIYLVLAALLAVYIVLGILYESTIHPITILSTLPSAGVGALLALPLMGMELNIIGFIGIILLVGIVKKNAIMMIDFALDLERKENKSPKEAIFEACILRFRPILMTTMAAILSALPLALGHGVGSELRRPLGVAIIGGLCVSQILTLFTTPVLYLTFENWAKKIKRKSSPEQPLLENEVKI